MIRYRGSLLARFLSRIINIASILKIYLRAARRETASEADGGSSRNER